MGVDFGVPSILHPLLSTGNAGPRLVGACDFTDAQLCGVDLHFAFGRVGHAQYIGGGGHYGGGFQFLDFQYTRLGVQHAAGYHFAPDLFGTVMGGPEGNEDIVPKGKEQTVRRTVPLRPHDGGPALGPPLPILPRFDLINRLAGRAAGLVKFRDLLPEKQFRVE